jgi:hypothetical protein
MPTTLDDKAVDVFKLYDEMTIAYSKDIEGYKAHIVAIEAMIAQKEEMLRDIKDKTVALVKTALEIIPSRETPVRKKSKVKRADKTKKTAKQSEKIAEVKLSGIKNSEKPAKTEKEIKCLYHPESVAVDIGKRLCSSCRCQHTTRKPVYVNAAKAKPRQLG